MKALLNGFNSKEATFLTTTTVKVGRAVALNSSGVLEYAANGAPFTGIVSSYKNKVAAVTMSGYAVAYYNATTPTIGICKLAPGSSGFMEVDETNGKPYTVVGIDTVGKKIEFIL